MALAGMTVVVGVDFDRTSDDAIREGLVLLLSGAARELHVVQVFAPWRGAESVARPWFASERQLVERASIALALRVANLARAAGLGSDPARALLHATVGPAVECLLAATRDYGADVLIVGAQAHCGAGRAKVGSVVAALVARGVCPVLIAPRHASSHDGVHAPQVDASGSFACERSLDTLASEARGSRVLGRSAPSGARAEGGSAPSAARAEQPSSDEARRSSTLLRVV